MNRFRKCSLPLLALALTLLAAPPGVGRRPRPGGPAGVEIAGREVPAQKEPAPNREQDEPEQSVAGEAQPAGKRRTAAGVGFHRATLLKAAQLIRWVPPMTARSFRLLVFDWDGTLMDSIGTIVDCTLAAFDGIANAGGQERRRRTAQRELGEGV